MIQIPSTKIIADVTKLSECSVLDENGKSILMKSFWQVRPAILIFLRHFACKACQKHAVEVWQNRADYASKGADLIFIGNGSSYFVKIFKEQNGLNGAQLYTDPSLKSFAAAGFRKGFWIDPGEMHSRTDFLYQAVRYQMRMTNEGNVWQLGGVLAICPGDKIKYQFTSQALGDFPPSMDVPNV